MNRRIVIAALSAVVIGAYVVPSLAQTPEESAAAKAAPQAPSEKLLPSSSAFAATTSSSRKFEARRSNESAGTTDLAKPDGKKSN
jgi:hypothetical protein